MKTPEIPFNAVHYFRAFYYVYRYDGFNKGAAAANASASTFSEQVALLEHELNVFFFERHPFRKLPAAHQLYHETVAPMAERLLACTRRLQLAPGRALKIGGSEFILHHYIIPLLEVLWQVMPKLQIMQEAGARPQLEAAVRRGDLDLVIGALDQPQPGLRYVEFLQRPVVLLVPADSRFRTAEQALASTTRLICPPPDDPVTIRVAEALQAMGRSASLQVQCSSTALVPPNVLARRGVGACVAVNRLVQHPQLRALPLPGARPVSIGAYCRDEPWSELEHFLKLLANAARQLVKDEA